MANTLFDMIKTVGDGAKLQQFICDHRSGYWSGVFIASLLASNKSVKTRSRVACILSIVVGACLAVVPEMMAGTENARSFSGLHQLIHNGTGSRCRLHTMKRTRPCPVRLPLSPCSRTEHGNVIARDNRDNQGLCLQNVIPPPSQH